METTHYSSENAHAEKQPFWKKGLTLEIKRGPLFQGLVYPKYSKLEVDYQVILMDHFYTIHQMYGPQIFWGHTHYDKQLGAWISHYLVECAIVLVGPSGLS